MQTEQEINDELEHLAGGPDRAFRLMNLSRQAEQAVSGDRFRISQPQRTQASVFAKLAKSNGYSDEVISFYVKHFQ